MTLWKKLKKVNSGLVIKSACLTGENTRERESLLLLLLLVEDEDEDEEEGSGGGGGSLEAII